MKSGGVEAADGAGADKDDVHRSECRGLVSCCSVCITSPGGTVPLRIGAGFRRCLMQPHCCCLLARPCPAVCLVGISRRQHRCFPSRPLSASLQPSVCPSPRFPAPLSFSAPALQSEPTTAQQPSKSPRSHVTADSIGQYPHTTAALKL